MEKERTCGENCGSHGSGRQCWQHKTTWLVGALVVILAIVQIAQTVKYFHETGMSVGITGRGTVAYVPDRAIVTLGVHVERVATAEEALRQMSERISAIMAAVEEQGVTRDMMQTTTYVIQPQYDWRDGTSVPVGYSADQQITIKVDGITEGADRTASVIAAATAAGANHVLNIVFDVKDVEALKQQARLAAMADAQTKAATQATAAGVRLSDVQSWYEMIVRSPDMDPSYPMPPYPVRMDAMNMGIGDSAVSNGQVPQGSDEIIIEVTIHYEVK